MFNSSRSITNIGKVELLAGNLSNEVTRATNAENALDGRLDTLEITVGGITGATGAVADRWVIRDGSANTAVNDLLCTRIRNSTGTLTQLQATTAGTKVGLGAGANTNGSSASSVFIGQSAGANVTSASSTIAIGDSALGSAYNLIGPSNVGIGYLSLTNATSTCQRNVALGTSSQRTTSTGQENVALGYNSMGIGTGAGTYNNCVAVGAWSQYANTSGNDDVAIGYNSAVSATTASENVSIGSSSLGQNVASSRNTAIGYQAGMNYSGGSNGENCAIGYKSSLGVTGEKNIVIGAYATVANGITGAVAIGYDTTCATSNTIQLGTTNTTTNCTNLNTSSIQSSGTIALSAPSVQWATAPTDGNDLTNKTYVDNLPVGGGITGTVGNATLLNSAVISNVLTGYSSGAGTVSATDTIVQGFNKLNGNISAINGLRFSPASCVAHTGSQNLSASGVNTTCVGQGAGLLLTSGSNNSAYGSNALNECSSGAANTAIGREALLTLQTGSNSTAVGSGSASLFTGSGLTAVGRNSATGHSTGDNCVCVGMNATVSNTFSNSCAIGYNASCNASNKIRLGDTNVTLVETSGAIASGAITSSGAVAGTELNVSTGGVTCGAILASGAIQSSSTVRGTNFLNSSGAIIVRGSPTSLSTVIGVNAGNGTMTGTGNTLMGPYAGSSLTNGSNNTFIGSSCGNDCTEGTYNVGLGQYAFGSLVDANHCVAVGYSTLGDLVQGDYNVAVGDGAGASVSYSPQNTFIGAQAGQTYDDYQSVFVGASSGTGVTSGPQVTYIGFSASGVTGLSNATAIGAYANATSSNSVQLGNSSVTTCNTYGLLTANLGFSTTANVGCVNVNATGTLTGAAISLTGSASGNFQKTVLTGTYSGAVTSGTQHVYVSRNGWTVTLNFDGFTDVATADGYLDFSVKLPAWALPSSSLVSADYPTTYQCSFLAFETGVRRPDCLIEIENALNANPTDVGRIRITASNGGTFTDTHAIGILPGNSVTYLLN